MKKYIAFFILITIMITSCSRNDAIIEHSSQTTLITSEQPDQTKEAPNSTDTEAGIPTVLILPENSVNENQSDEKAVNFASETKEPGHAQIYYDFVRETNTEYLFEADLADLDGDGIPELVKITEVTGGKPEYGYYSDLLIEIYKNTVDGIILLDSFMFGDPLRTGFAHSKYCMIYLASYNGKDYLCFDNYWSHQGGGTLDLYYLSLDNDGKMAVEFKCGENEYETIVSGAQISREDLALEENTNVIEYDYFDNDGTWNNYFRLVDYWINEEPVSETVYEALISKIETRMDIWKCWLSWSEISTENFTYGERLRDYFEPESERSRVTTLEWKADFNDYGDRFSLYLTVDGETDYFAGDFWPGVNFELNDNSYVSDAPENALATLSTMWTGEGQWFYICYKSNTELAVMNHPVIYPERYISGVKKEIGDEEYAKQYREYQEVLSFQIEKDNQIQMKETVIIKKPEGSEG